MSSRELVRRAGGRPADAGTGRNVDPERALRNMGQLAIAGKVDALYSLPIDQPAGQISVAAQSVLDYPRKNPDLALILSSGADVDDLITILSEPPSIAVPRTPGGAPSPQE